MPLDMALRFDDAKLLGRLEKPHKRIGFAAINAINSTLKLAQRAVVLHADRVLNVRKTVFIHRNVAVLKFAKVKAGPPVGEIAVGKKKRLLLPGLVFGALRKPFKGSKSVAVPVEARSSEKAPVDPSLFFRKLAFRKPRGQKRIGSKSVFPGKFGTYLIPGEGVFQRSASGSSSRVLYVFARPFFLPESFKFYQVVQRIVRRNFPRILKQEVRDAFEFRGIKAPRAVRGVL